MGSDKKSDFDKINQAVLAQDNTEILRLSTKLLEKYPTFTWFRLLRAMALLSQNQYDAVIKDAQLILQLADAPCEECLPDCKTLHANAYDLMGRAYRGLNDLEQAEAFFRKRAEMRVVKESEPSATIKKVPADNSILTELTIGVASLALLFYIWEL